MNTQQLPQEHQHVSPAGAEVRILMSNSMAGAAHCTLKKGKISRAVTHKTVSEFWHVISGCGEIWRKQNNEELITTLSAGTTIDIPLGTHFQYRSTGESDLVFICLTMPPWPGSDEVSFIEEGTWKHTV